MQKKGYVLLFKCILAYRFLKKQTFKDLMGRWAKIYDDLGNDKPGIYYYRGKDKLLSGKWNKSDRVSDTEIAGKRYMGSWYHAPFFSSHCSIFL